MARQPRARGWTALPAAALMTACALASTDARAKTRARVTTPADYTVALAEGPRQTTSDRWWGSFADPAMTALIEQGLADNYDVLAAAERITEAQARARENLAPLLPSASFDVTANTAPVKTLGFQFGGIGGSMMSGVEPPTLYFTGSALLNVGLEIDITGRRVLALRAAKDDARASAEDRDAVALQLSASIAEAYFDVLATRAQLAIVREQIATNEALLELTQARFGQGSASAVEVLQQRQQVASTRASLPQARAQLRVAELQLSTLLGQAPGAALPLDRGAARLPALPPPPPLGRPVELLEARPDLRASTARLSAAERRRKAQAREFAPSLRLSGQAGWQFIDIGELNTQEMWGAGATLSIPLLLDGRAYNGLRRVEASERAARGALQQQTLNAVREVETALTREREQLEVLAATAAQRDAAARAFSQARARFAAGLSDYLSVLNTVTTLERADLGLLTAQRELLSIRVQLHVALGGPLPRATG